MILGITGGICTGKTTAASVLVGKGARVVDCDEISHYLSAYDTAVQTAIREHFGENVFFGLGALNRPVLANVVFADDQEREALERILHPPIKAVVQANIELCEKLGMHLVVVAPLLIEAGMTSLMDRLWLITCAAEAQLNRLCQRAGIDHEDAKLRIEAQMALEQKEKYADAVILNDGRMDDFKNNVEKQWNIFLEQG